MSRVICSLSGKESALVSNKRPKNYFRLDSNDFGFMFDGVSNVGQLKQQQQQQQQQQNTRLFESELSVTNIPLFEHHGKAGS